MPVGTPVESAGEATVTARIREVESAALDEREIDAIRALMDRAFGDGEERFTDDDWAHARGGRHFLLEVDGDLVGHASVVERELHVGGRPVRTGYVEAVAIEPARQGAGFGSALMEPVQADILARFELGALGTGRHTFYERLGWLTWRGPSAVRTETGEHRTPDEDGDILVLETPSTPIRPLDLDAPISCDWRPGDVW
jgi:aminoglycoside 2'-N-acetyltransferase I